MCLKYMKIWMSACYVSKYPMLFEHDRMVKEGNCSVLQMSFLNFSHWIGMRNASKGGTQKQSCLEVWTVSETCLQFEIWIPPLENNVRVRSGLVFTGYFTIHWFSVLVHEHNLHAARIPTFLAFGVGSGLLVALADCRENTSQQPWNDNSVGFYSEILEMPDVFAVTRWACTLKALGQTGERKTKDDEAAKNSREYMNTGSHS